MTSSAAIVTVPVLISIALCSGALGGPAGIPTKEGTYTHKGWKYVYEIQNPGKRAERRIGKLYLNGEEVKGIVGELNQEPIGTFLYFGEHGSNQGWLNTLTYDQAAFDKVGNPTPQATRLLQMARAMRRNPAPENPVQGSNLPR